MNRPFEKNIECWLAYKCPGKNCGPCRANGLHFLSNKIFIPRSRIPLEYLFSNPYTWDTEEYISEVFSYVRKIPEIVHAGKGLYLYSPEFGTGKTTLACLCLREYLHHYLLDDPDPEETPILFLNVNDFLEELRMSFNDPEHPARYLMEDLLDIDWAPRLLVLDDLGVENHSEWVMRKLYSLINFRVSNRLATIYTSNFSIDELGNTTEWKRIASRITRSTHQIRAIGKDRSYKQG